MSTLEQLKATLADLPIEMRVELARHLLSTLQPSDPAVKAEWLALAERRIDEVESGRAKGIPADEVLDTLLDDFPDK